MSTVKCQTPLPAHAQQRHRKVSLTIIPRFFAFGPSCPASRCARQVDKCDEYNPRLRISADSSPLAVHASASASTSSFSFAENLRRVARAFTSVVLFIPFNILSAFLLPKTLIFRGRIFLAYKTIFSFRQTSQ